MLHHHIRAFDEERDANFDEVWDEELVPTLLDEKKYKKYWCWLSQIDLKTSENQGEIENPRTLTLPIGSDIVLTIEFHPCCTYYFLNDTLIGRLSRLLIVFIGLNVLLKILRLFDKDKFLLYKMFFVMIKKL